MRFLRSRSGALSVALVIVTLATAPVLAQSLPPADEVIADYVEAIGGRAAHLELTSIRQVGTVSVAGLGVSGEFEILIVLPDRTLTRIVLPGMGEVLTGFDGTYGWTTNPLLGPMLMEGDELDEMAERSHVLAALRDPALAPLRETVELSEAGGEACWSVRLVWLSGRESFDCFSAASGLLIASEDTQASMMGTVPVSTRYGDYQAFGQTLLPTRITQTSMGQELEILIREVEIGNVDPAELEPPPAVRTLLEAQPGG